MEFISLDEAKILRLQKTKNHLQSLKQSDNSYQELNEKFYFWEKFEKKFYNYQPVHLECPSTLFFKGKNWQSLNSELTVGFGGTLAPTNTGSIVTTLIAQDVCKSGGTVISGGAIGIDTAAHLGALDVNGSTIAVLPNSVQNGLHPYMVKRKFLEEGILTSGGFISEYNDTASDYYKRLHPRVRLITALSDVFIVIESKKDSGTVDAAKRAFLQGKKVLAIDWDAIDYKKDDCIKTGNTQLFEEQIASPFPLISISSTEELHREIDKILSEHLVDRKQADQYIG
jgi:DNA processing protein